MKEFGQIPLAEIIRPKKLEDVVGQEHLTEPGKPLYNLLKKSSAAMHSFILYGPPGTGKTTLAHIISNESGRKIFYLSALNAGVKDIRDAIQEAQIKDLFRTSAPILFIDEIHRFSKNQQDSLLEAVEKGIIVLIGATTENPSFELNNALLSRCQIYTLRPLNKEAKEKIVKNALQYCSSYLDIHINIEEDSILYQLAGNDARKLVTSIEILAKYCEDATSNCTFTDEKIKNILQQNIRQYDKDGNFHYDIISAMIKSIRGSDVDASLYYLGRMLAGGENVEFIGRRLVISAAEDIGLANPNALLIANACLQSCAKIGMPEARIILSQCTIYLASSPKSNSAYLAIDKVLTEISQSGDLPVPLHLRNAGIEYEKDSFQNASVPYIYPHNYESNYYPQEYLPEDLKGKVFYTSSAQLQEQKLAQYLFKLKNDYSK